MATIIPTFNKEWFEDIRKKFISKIIKLETGCWDFKSTLSPDGYRRFYTNGNDYRASRISYQFFKGTEGLKELDVLHTCDNRWCVNPEHLYLGTELENCSDKTRRGRNPHCSLVPEQVVEILYRHEAKQSVKELSKLFNISCGQCYMIINGKSWKELAI